jgi:uncharacterized membrane protein
MVNNNSKGIRTFISNYLFQISLFIKGFDGVLEFIFGILLLIFRADRISAFIISYANGELTEEPNNRIASYLLRHGHISAETASFTAMLLIARGVVKLLVITGLLQRKVWVYPIAIIVFAGFSVFELYTYTHTHSILLIILAAFDLFVVLLTVREYRLLRSRKA